MQGERQWRKGYTKKGIVIEQKKVIFFYYYFLRGRENPPALYEILSKKKSRDALSNVINSITVYRTRLL